MNRPANVLVNPDPVTSAKTTNGYLSPWNDLSFRYRACEEADQAIEPQQAPRIEPAVNPLLAQKVGWHVDPFRLTAANMLDAKGSAVILPLMSRGVVKARCAVFT